MDFHSHSKVDDDTYDVDAWTSFDDDDEDYCYGCEDWTDNDGHGNCKTCGVKFDSIDGDAWATAHTTKTSVATAPLSLPLVMFGVEVVASHGVVELHGGKEIPLVVPYLLCGVQVIVYMVVAEMMHIG